MGLRFRKGINIGGGFRINLSKTGFGYSWGIPGARFTKTATGRNRATLSIPGTGISYVKDFSDMNRGSSVINLTDRRTNTQQSGYNVLTPLETFESACVSEFVPAEYQDFLNAINRYSKINQATKYWFLLICLTIFSIYFFIPIGILMFIITLICIIIRINNKMNNKIEAYYEIDENLENRFDIMNELMGFLLETEFIWQINDLLDKGSDGQPTGTQNVNRTKIDIQVVSPQFIKTNITCFSIKLKDETLYLFPDKLLIEKNNHYGAIPYEEITSEFGNISYLEDVPPSDAEIIEETWRYVTKSGNPDKRYKDNYKRYLCKYGISYFTTEQGFTLLLYFSGEKKLEHCVERLIEIVNAYKEINE